MHNILKTGDWRLETGDWRLETGDWRPMSISIDKPTLKNIRSCKKSLRAHLLSIGGYLYIHLFVCFPALKLTISLKILIQNM